MTSRKPDAGHPAAPSRSSWWRRLDPGRLLSPVAVLAAAVSPSRAGTTSPAIAPALASAPGVMEPEAFASARAPLRRSLRACVTEGLVSEIVAAFAGGAVLTGWAIHLHASALLTGLVVALPQLAQLLQIPAAWTTGLLGHRRAALVLVAASRQVVLPLALLPLLDLSDHARQTVLVAVSAVAAILGVLGNNAWVTWMGELVPRRVRGRYFGRRTALCTVGGALASAGAGLLLDWARPRGLTGAALAGLQIAACASGAVTTWLMARQHDPAPHADPPPLHLRQVMIPLRDPSVRGLLTYLTTWNLAVGVAGSFFSLHMLKNLRMGFTLVALHGIGLACARMLSAPLWGRLVDRQGARPVLVTTAFGISAIPLIWLFPTPNCLWPLALDAVLAGVLWGGHNLAAFALPLSVTPRRSRPFYLAVFAAASGVAFSVATAGSGLLAALLPERMALFGRTFDNLHGLFALSALLRFGAAFLALRIHEPAAAGVSALFAGVVGRDIISPQYRRVAVEPQAAEPPGKEAAAG